MEVRIGMVVVIHRNDDPKKTADGRHARKLRAARRCIVIKGARATSIARDPIMAA
jgi:glyceraldehyde-3-phosphate dehydrogenase/erythrose-4-phosphate dehydrogenase